MIVYDMIWYDMIWYDMMWYDIIWYDMVWCDMIWYDVIWYDMLWCNMNIDRDLDLDEHYDCDSILTIKEQMSIITHEGTVRLINLMDGHCLSSCKSNVCERESEIYMGREVNRLIDR